MSQVSEKATTLASMLSLEEKVALLTGFDFWNTVPNERIGLRKIVMSDGPAGVRGEFWDERDNSLNLPSGTALGSTWSVEIASEYGRVLAREAARKGVDVVLGPTINLHRSPLGGRHFECLSEDVLLTSVIGSAFVKAIQSQGKAACPKHYVANDFETDRYNVDVRVDEKTLNEVYLRPFEEAISEGGAWTIMSSYNQINGTTASENDLLHNPLREQWEFDGVVISDWTAVRSLESAKAEQDLVMPGPDGPWGSALVDAVRNGTIPEATVDRKVIRLLMLAERVGALGQPNQTPAAPERHNDIIDASLDFARRAAVAGSVLMQNDGVLPLNFEDLQHVALIGHNGTAARTQGGGSATVLPKSVVTPLHALKAELGDRLTYSIGAVVQEGIGELPALTLTNPVSGVPGVQVDFLNESHEVIYSEERLAARLTWLGSNAPVSSAAFMRIRTRYIPEETSTQLFGYASPQPVEIKLNGDTFLKHHAKHESDDPFLALMDPPYCSAELTLQAGVPIDIDIEIDLAGRTGIGVGAQSFVFGFEADTSIGDANIADAVHKAKSADLAIVVVGTNAQVESEGFDRQDLHLPGRQNELVEAVVAANPNTIVIVNSGSPVLMPWRNKVRAILVTYFGGQEMGNALINMLAGREEPGGRLPTTWPETLEDVPVVNCTPAQPGNYVRYEEGIHIGYRAWLKAGVTPAYEFGHGLGYTTWAVTDLNIPSEVNRGDDVIVKVKVANTGTRFGKHIVQLYASRTETSVDRPALWLVGFAEVKANAGDVVEVDIAVRGREFAHWDTGWAIEPGEFLLSAGSSVGCLSAQSSIYIK